MNLKTLLIAILFGTFSANAKVQIDTNAPDFTLTDTAGNDVSLSSFAGKYVVLEWTNHQCPYVKKHYGCNNMQDLQKKYTE